MSADIRYGQMVRSLSSTVSATMALAGFSIALIAGLLGSNHLATTLERGLIACAVCFLVGLVVGYLLDGVIKRHAAQMRFEVDQAERVERAALDPGLDESDVGDSVDAGDGLLAV